MGAKYTQLSYEERRRIERWRHANMSVDEVAAEIGRHRSTVYREMRRNRFVDDELPKLTDLRAAVIARLMAGPLSSLLTAAVGQWDRPNRSPDAWALRAIR